MVRHVRFGRRDVRERRETFVSFVAPRPGVSRHAVTVTARNARRFVRHGVSIASLAPQRGPRFSISITSASGHPAAALRLPTALRSHPAPVASFASAQHTYQPPSSSGLRIRASGVPARATNRR